MFWYWKVRIYNTEGMYVITFVKTNRVLAEIAAIQDFYFELTDCKMLLEGMSDTPLESPKQPIGLQGFHILWESK